MAESLIRSWWARVRGRLVPRPCPHSQAWVLDLRVRSWRAGPRRIVGAFGLRSGQRVLEIGPGTGYYSEEAARSVTPGGRLYCLDIQVEMLHTLKKRLRTGDECWVEVIQGDAAELPIRSSSIDHVFLIAVLGEIPNRSEALQEIHRVLRPQGRLSVSEQFPDPDFVGVPTLRRELADAGFVEERTRGRLVYTSNWRAS